MDRPSSTYTTNPNACAQAATSATGGRSGNRLSHFGRAALAYARRGVPVFPCWPGVKAPITPHGFKDATTDPATIICWWTEHPNANIGIPTGPASGIFVLDADVESGGLEALEGLPELPPTTRVRTGGGGLHFYWKYPEGQSIRNGPGSLDPRLHVRGDGGYILAPPSKTAGPYEIEAKLPAAPAPEWLLEQLRQRQRPAPDAAGRTHNRVDNVKSVSSLCGGIIGAGMRNRALTSIGGRLRAEGKTREELEAALLDVNAARCAPALEVGEVMRIASSVSRYAPGNLKPPPSPETLALIDVVERRLWSQAWAGMGGKTERDVMVCLLDLARRHGQPSPDGDGVEVSIGIRALALAAAVSKNSCLRALKRLYGSELRRGADGAGGKAGTLVLLAAQSGTIQTTARVRVEKKANGPTLRAPRLRWSSPAYNPKRGLVRDTLKVREGPKPERRDRTRRLGKTCGAAVDALDKYGPSLEVDALARILGAKRPRDLRRRVIARLEACGVVSCAGDLVSLTDDWLEALNRERELAGELAQHERQLLQTNLESVRFRNRHKLPKADPVPESPAASCGGPQDAAAPKISRLAAAIRAYLDLNPCDACQPASWLGLTMWAHDIYPGKPTPTETRAAIAELGGGRYLRECLERARQALEREGAA